MYISTVKLPETDTIKHENLCIILRETKLSSYTLYSNRISFQISLVDWLVSWIYMIGLMAFIVNSQLYKANQLIL